MYNVQVTPIIGLPHFDGWSHVTTSQGQRVIWALALEGEQARNLGRDLLDVIGQDQPGTAADFYRIFEQVVAEAQTKRCRLSCAAAFFEDGVGTYAAFEAQVLLRRNDKLGVLIDGLDSQKVVQGELRDDDLYILSTSQASRFLEEVRLKISQGYETDSIVTSLTPSLQLESNTSLCAMAFVKIGKQRFSQAAVMASPEDDEVAAPPVSSTRVAAVELDLGGDEALDTSAGPDSVATSEPVVAPKTLLTPEPVADRVPLADVSLPTPAVEKETPPPTNELGLPIRPDLVPDDWRAGSGEGEEEAGPVVDLSALGGKVVGRLKTSAIRLGKASGGALRKVGPFLGPKIAEFPGLLKKLINLGQRLLKRLISRDVYVSQAQSRRLARYIAIGLVGLLVIGGAIGWWSYQRSQALAEVRSEISPLSDRLTNAQTQLEADPIAARDQVVAILDDLTALEARFQGNRVALGEIAQFEAEARVVYEEVSGRDELVELPIRIRLTDFVDNFIASKMTWSDQTLWLVDVPTNQLVIYSLEDDSAQTVELDREGEAIRDLTALSAEEAVVMAGDQLSLVNLSGQLSEIETSDNFVGGRLVRSFGNNLYAFNPSRRNLYRLGGDGQGYADSRVWLRSSQGIEFDNIISMTIDGDIWLGDRQGDIFQLRSGQPQDFAVSGLENDFASDLYLYTRDDLEYLYVLEPESRRLVLLTKQGGFVREIVSASLASATSLVVSETGDRALIASGSLVYELVF